jgi:hypothetical protein
MSSYIYNVPRGYPPFFFMYSFICLRKYHNNVTRKTGGQRDSRQTHTPFTSDWLIPAPSPEGLHDGLVFHRTINTHVTCWFTSGRQCCSVQGELCRLCLPRTQDWHNKQLRQIAKIYQVTRSFSLKLFVLGNQELRPLSLFRVSKLIGQFFVVLLTSIDTLMSITSTCVLHGTPHFF